MIGESIWFDPGYLRSDLIPILNNTYSIGNSSFAIKDLYQAGEHIFTGSANVIRPNTADGSDNASLTLCGGGAGSAIRGSYCSLNGNESAGAGWWEIGTGNVSGASGKVKLNHSLSRFYISDASNNDLFKFSADTSITFGNAGLTIVTNTADGADNRFVAISAGGGTGTNRSSSFTLYANEHGNAGGLDILTGATSSNGLNLFNYSTSGAIRMGCGAGTERFNISHQGNIGVNLFSYGSGQGIIAILNAAANPSSNPSGGGFLYCDSGALKYRGSSGTITTIASA